MLGRKMARVLSRKTAFLAFTIPSLIEDNAQFQKFKEARGLYIEDPWERVKSIFYKDDFGHFHPELDFALKTAEIGFFIGFAYGGIKSLNQNVENLNRFDTKIFTSKREGVSFFGNQGAVDFMKGGIKWGPRLFILMGGFSLISSCCELYRNDIHITDSTIGGAGIGGIVRSYLGYRGILAGAAVGGALGTLYGIFFWGLAKLTRQDKLELKYISIAYSRYKKHLRDSDSTNKIEPSRRLEVEQLSSYKEDLEKNLNENILIKD